MRVPTYHHIYPERQQVIGQFFLSLYRQKGVLLTPVHGGNNDFSPGLPGGFDVGVDNLAVDIVNNGIPFDCDSVSPVSVIQKAYPESIYILHHRQCRSACSRIGISTQMRYAETVEHMHCKLQTFVATVKSMIVGRKE